MVLHKLNKTRIFLFAVNNLDHKKGGNVYGWSIVKQIVKQLY